MIVSAIVLAVASAVASIASAAAACAAVLQAGHLAREAEERKSEAQRRAIAGALLGEMEAYIKLLGIESSRKNFIDLASHADDKDLLLRLASFPKLPTGHPVFDRCADQLGVLPGDLPREISKLYNIVTSFRAMMSHLSDPGVLMAPIEIPRKLLQQLVMALDAGQEIADAVLPELQKIRSGAEPSHRTISPFRWFK
jgi:hypothetical protein